LGLRLVWELWALRGLVGEAEVEDVEVWFLVGIKTTGGIILLLVFKSKPD
jgi:hypothetical protein